MESVSNVNLSKSSQTKEKGHGLTFIRKTLLKRSNSINEPSSSITNPPNNEEIINSQLSANCHCQRNQQEKNRKNSLKLWKKKIHIKNTFLKWQSKRKVKASETSDDSSKGFQTEHFKKDSSICPVQFSHNDCDNRNLIRNENDCIAPQEDSGTLINHSIEQQQTRGISTEILKLSHEGWYWGPVTKQEAVHKLQGHPDGTFLVRDSSSDSYLFTISFRSSGKTLHCRIDYNYNHGSFRLYANVEFTSIIALINHLMSKSQEEVYFYSQPNSLTEPEFPVRLTTPLSRFTQVRSLQYLCRFVIRQYTGLDDIQKLPLPAKIKDYIEEGHY